MGVAGQQQSREDTCLRRRRGSPKGDGYNLGFCAHVADVIPFGTLWYPLVVIVLRKNLVLLYRDENCTSICSWNRFIQFY
jgi:hypothetical protein